MDALTIKQATFVDAYTGEARGNGVQAARIAGYKGAYMTLNAIAGENLQKPLIKEALAQRAAKAMVKADKHIVNTYVEFQKNLEFVSKLRDASHKWLDAANTGEYHIEPRAEEIDIIYYDFAAKALVTERLDVILARLADAGIPKPSPFIKTTDLREYALKVIDRIDTCLDKFAKMGGDYTKERDNPQDTARLLGIVKDWYDRMIKAHELSGEAMPGRDDIEVEVKRLCEPNGVDVRLIMDKVVGE